MNAEGFAARARGILTIPKLLERLRAIKTEEKSDVAKLVDQAIEKLQRLLEELRSKDDSDIVAKYLNEDLDAYESTVKRIEDHVAGKQTVKMVFEAMNR